MIDTLAKCPTGIDGLDTSPGRPAARPADPDLRRRRLREDAVRDGVPGPRRDRSSASPASSSLRGDRRGPRPQRRLARLRSGQRLVARRQHRDRSCPVSSAAKSRRPATTTSRGCSSASRYAIDAIGAKRVVLDTIEALFSGLPNRPSCAPNFAGCSAGSRTKGVTAVITGERGGGDADPPRPRGVRLGLRHPARPSRHEQVVDPAPARRQVSRHRRTAPTSTRS